jgi:hypothetical protein
MAKDLGQERRFAETIDLLFDLLMHRIAYGQRRLPVSEEEGQNALAFVMGEASRRLGTRKATEFMNAAGTGTYSLASFLAKSGLVTAEKRVRFRRLKEEARRLEGLIATLHSSTRYSPQAKRILKQLREKYYMQGTASPEVIELHDRARAVIQRDNAIKSLHDLAKKRGKSGEVAAKYLRQLKTRLPSMSPKRIRSELRAVEPAVNLLLYRRGLNRNQVERALGILQFRRGGLGARTVGKYRRTALGLSERRTRK